MLFYIKPFYQRWWGSEPRLIIKFSRSRQSVWLTGGICAPVDVGTVRRVRF